MRDSDITAKTATVSGDKPFRRLLNDTSFWQLFDRLDDYDQWLTSRYGRYRENLFAVTHATSNANVSVLVVYIGPDDEENFGDEWIEYNWRQHRDVAQSLEVVKAYQDFYIVCSDLGYEQNHPVVVTAVEQIQGAVNAARIDAGLPVG